MLSTFEDLDVWKRSSKLASDILIEINQHPNFAIRDQISRSAFSIPSNIAEGSERDSTKDYIRFLRISKGSCAELRTQLYINHKVSKTTGQGEIKGINLYLQETKEILAMLQGLINSLNKRKQWTQLPNLKTEPWKLNTLSASPNTNLTTNNPHIT